MHAPTNGSSRCLLCASGWFQDERGQAECKSCPPGNFCPQGSTRPGMSCSQCTNDTLATLIMARGTWRLGPHSDDVHRCRTVGDTTPCVGGAAAGIDGAGYCAEGHRGPLCQVCSNHSFYFQVTKAQCVECQLSSRLGNVAAIVAAVVVVAVLFFAVLVRYLQRLRWYQRLASRLASKAAVIAVIPKLKLFIAL